MKRWICLLLATVTLLPLAACGETAPAHTAAPTAAGLSAKPLPTDAILTEPLPENPPAVTSVDTGGYVRYAAALAAAPELPAKPDKEELYAALDAAESGEEADAAWKAYEQRESKYEAALRALRGEGVDEAFTDALRAYTLRTAQTILIGESGKNTAYSPANLYLALCVLAQCTAGESCDQLLDLLGLADAEECRSLANAIWRSLYSEKDGTVTELANSVWLSELEQVNEETAQMLAEDDFASVFSVPMGAAETDNALQEWVNEHTGHLLEAAAGALKTDPDTVFAIISALYFKGNWRSPFFTADTAQNLFTGADGKPRQMDFMHRTDTHAAYYRPAEGGFTMAELFFGDGKAMRILLPDEGVTADSLIVGGALEAMLDDGTWKQHAEVRWSVPKFDVSSDLSLTGLLRQLGVSAVFDDTRADFSPIIYMEQPAAVTQIEHAARVRVDEEGCEAAAFTAIMTEATGMRPEEETVIEMNLNRPFLFLITGEKGLPLFIGAVNEG